MYGFVEQRAKNVYESVDIPLQFIRDLEGVTEKMEYQERYCIDSITVSSTGVLYDEEVGIILEILTKDSSHKRRRIEEMNQDLDCENDILTFEQILKKRGKWCPILRTITRAFCNKLNVLYKEKQKYVGQERRKNSVLMLLENKIAVLSIVLDSFIAS